MTDTYVYDAFGAIPSSTGSDNVLRFTAEQSDGVLQVEAIEAQPTTSVVPLQRHRRHELRAIRGDMEVVISHSGQRRVNDPRLRVLVDDEVRCEVRRGDAVRFSLDHGDHAIRVENRTDSSETLVVRAEGARLGLEAGLYWRADRRRGTAWNILVRGPELGLRPEIPGDDRIVSVSSSTKYATGTRDFLERYFVRGTVAELRVFGALTAVLAIVATLWFGLRAIF